MILYDARKLTPCMGARWRVASPWHGTCQPHIVVSTPRIARRATESELAAASTDLFVEKNISTGLHHIVRFSGESFSTEKYSVGDQVGIDGEGETTDGHENEVSQLQYLDLNEENAFESLLSFLRTLFLPQGWPDSVTPDYLTYQLWTFPSHVTGWMSTSLAGSSMLKALGMDAPPVASVGFSAGIKWVIKDGIGALGRFFVGGRLGEAFDEDPRRWRMIAEAISTLGLALEIATQIYPSQFVLLAGSGTLARATGKGIGRPCFRVVQTHFGADHNNVGAVAAKEEVWEVTAQLIGLGASVGVLSVLDGTGNPGIIIPVWVVVHGIHVGIRYLALKKLRFPWLNYKRAVSVLISHVKTRVVPSINFVNENEPILGDMKSMGFSCKFGCSLIEALEVTSNIQGEAKLEHKFARNDKLLQLITIYKNEKYILVWGSSTTAHIILREGAGSREMLRAAWQAAWLYDQSTQEDGEDADPHQNWLTYVELLERSLNEMQISFNDMWEKAAKEGWELERTVLPVGPYRLQEVDSLDQSNRESYSHEDSNSSD